MLAGGGRLTSHCSSNEFQLLATLPADSHGASPVNLLHEWLTFTLPETNSHLAPENGWLEDDLASFWGPERPILRGELLVLGRV